MVDKFDSTAHERGTTATIPPQYYVPKKSEDYWIDVVDEGVGKSGLPNKTRRQGILNLLEDRMRKDPLMRLGFQELVGDDPSASGIVTLIKKMRLDKEHGLKGAMLPAFGKSRQSKTYQYVRNQIEQRIAEGKAPSHLPPTDFDSTQENYQYSTGLPSGSFRDRPVAAYTLSDFIGDRPAPAGYDPAYMRGIMSLAHEIRHAGVDALWRQPTGTVKEMRAVDKLFNRPTRDEPLMRAYDAASRKHDPLSLHFMDKSEREQEGRGIGMYPKPYKHPAQSAAAKMLRDQYAGRELYAPLARQPR